MPSQFSSGGIQLVNEDLVGSQIGHKHETTVGRTTNPMWVAGLLSLGVDLRRFVVPNLRGSFTDRTVSRSGKTQMWPER